MSEQSTDQTPGVGDDPIPTAGTYQEEPTEPFESKLHYSFAGYWGFSVLSVLTVVSSNAILTAIGMAFFIGAAACGVATFWTYIEESNRLRDAGADWVPTWWAYALAQIFLSPYFVSLVYLYQRYRHIGLGVKIRDKNQATASSHNV